MTEDVEVARVWWDTLRSTAPVRVDIAAHLAGTAPAAPAATFRAGRASLPKYWRTPPGTHRSR
ncbi:hypothetical protein [Streptomyces sp. NPDC051561]|uniref:hypothetical protein n=1 Tax=Streptomyces sp. NPDC051561 TaxID=3365658 RepID=UPI0037AEFE72